MSEQAGKQKINAYKRINLFLQKFLLHGNADIKYQIASKGFLEQTLDMEFRQVIQDTDPCVLYRGKLDPLFRIPTVKLKIPGKSIFEIRNQNFCYIQVIVFDLVYLPVAAVET